MLSLNDAPNYSTWFYLWRMQGGATQRGTPVYCVVHQMERPGEREKDERVWERKVGLRRDSKRKENKKARVRILLQPCFAYMWAKASLCKREKRRGKPLKKERMRKRERQGECEVAWIREQWCGVACERLASFDERSVATGSHHRSRTCACALAVVPFRLTYRVAEFNGLHTHKVSPAGS